MHKDNRKEQLQKIYQKRKAHTALKVDEAINVLLQANKSINFHSVAKEAGTARPTLYNNPEIRKIIELLRQQEKQIKREMNKNLDDLIEPLERKIQKLEDENNQLRDQLEVAYAEVYINLKNLISSMCNLRYYKN